MNKFERNLEPNEAQKEAVKMLQNNAAVVDEYLNDMAKQGADPRKIVVARINNEQSEMWAVKAVMHAEDFKSSGEAAGD